MKSLSLQRPLAIVVIGAPGAGKTYFANQFAEMFGAPLVSFDQLHYRLFNQPTFDSDETAIVNDVMQMHIAELVKTQKVVLIDGGYNSRVKRAELNAFLKKAGYDMLLVWVQTDMATAKRRSMRTQSGSKGTPHRAISAEHFVLLAKKMTPPNVRENYVVISGKHLFGSQAKAVLKKLVAPREEAVRPPQSRPPQQRQQPPARRNVMIS